jgi:uncharacterized OsmC-like protein
MADTPLANRELRTTLDGSGFRIEVKNARHSWTLDEPPEDGGTDAGPSPVDAFLGALVSCLSLSFQFYARRQGVPIQRIEGWVVANQDRQIEAIAVELQVWSSAAEQEVRDLLPRAKRGCFVSNVLRPDLAYTVELAVYPAEGSARPAD